MPQSHGCVYVHVVFGTFDRRPMIDGSICDALYGYMGGILRRRGCPVIQIGGTADHVHLLFRLSRERAIAEVVKELKVASTKWVREQPNGANDFSWQAGYGVFSVSASQADRAAAYIRNQEAHHARQDFKEEFEAILRQHGVEYDPKYLWR